MSMNLDGAVQDFADLIGNPVIVFDTEMNVAAFSVHEGDIDRARLNMILTHRATRKAVEMIHEHRVERAPGAVLLPPVDGIPARVIAALRYRSRVTGYVSYPPGEQEPLFEQDGPEVLAARAQLAAFLAARESELKEGSDKVLRLTSRLLDSQASGRAAAAAELIDEGFISQAPQYSAMVFKKAGDGDQTDANANARLVVDHALKEISRFSSLRSLGTVIDNEGVLIIPREINPDRLRRLAADPLLSRMRAGGGSSRSRLANIRESLREARIAARATLRAPDSYGSTALWKDLGLDRLLLQLPLERMTRDDLPASTAALLDETAGPDLARTLEAYLDSGADAQQTALALHIHRSTLYYRLDRIRALINADLSDGDVRRELHTSLRIASLAGLR